MRMAIALSLLFGCSQPAASPAERVAPPAPIAAAPAAPAPADAAPTQTPAPAPREPSALALVIDRSGSMSGEPIELARKACHAAVDELGADDHVVVIAFDVRPIVLVPPRRVGDGVAVHAGIDRIQPGGGTEIFPALESAHQAIGPITGARRRILLLSDGQAPVSGIRELVEQMRADGIVVSAVGLGESYDRALLELIASLGGGRFHPVAETHTLPTVFRAEVLELTAEPPGD